MGRNSRHPPDFRALFDATPGLYLILSPGLEIVAVNDAYCRATMTKREAIVGRHLFDAFPDNPDDVGATGVGNLRASLDRVRRLKRADTMAIQKYDIRKPEEEGGEFEERHWSPLNSPVLSKNGELLWIIHRVEDVTEMARLTAADERQRAYAREQVAVIAQLRAANEELARTSDALRASEARFRTVANNLPGVVYRRVIRPDGKARDTYVSDGVKAILGVDPERVMSGECTLMDFTHPDDLERKLRAMREAAIKGEPLTIEVRKLAQPDHQVRWWQTNMTPTRLDDGAVQWDGIAIDITDRKATEQQLHQAIKMEAVGQLTGGVAHDFNNLLTVILGNAEALVEQLNDNQRLRVLAELTQTAAERGSELTNRLLAFARRQALEPKVLDINKLVAGMDGLLRRTLGEDTEIELIRAAGLWQAMVDPAQLESALLNLAINARDAMHSGGKLTIETANSHVDATYAAAHDEVTPGQYVLISVTDTGCGMTAETMARAFEPFYSTKEIGKGTGLGLSMVYGFVKQSGGHIKLYSEPDFGTTVKIYLPRAVASGVDDMRGTETKGDDPRGTEMVLLVEDDDMVRTHVEGMLRHLGYRVIIAHDGPEAMRIIDGGEPFDLLFTDVVMPGGMTGGQLADLATARRPGLKVLFTSGYTENAIVHQGRLDRGVHLIRKPYRRRDLAAKLRQVLGPMNRPGA